MHVIYIDSSRNHRSEQAVLHDGRVLKEREQAVDALPQAGVRSNHPLPAGQAEEVDRRIGVAQRPVNGTCSHEDG